MASVTFEGNFFLIILTISAFYFGETLHAKTTFAIIAISKNDSFIDKSFSKVDKEAPDIIIAYFID